MLFVFIAVRSPLTPKLKDLDLVEVSDWYGLGLQLDIDDRELDRIGKDYSNEKMRTRKMFSTWLHLSPDATYHQLARALFLKREIRSATQLCKKHGRFSVGMTHYCRALC